VDVETTNNGNGSDLAKENENLKSKIKELEEKLDTLKAKRAEDRDKVRELDKTKIQLQQLQEFKSKAQKEISDLNKELVQTKQESKVYKEQYEQYKDEMNNHEQRIEEITVDKELAEAKIEEQQDEINKLNDKIEEIQLELDVLKGEIEVNGTSGATDSYQLKQAEKEQERLKAALIKYSTKRQNNSL
jgi:dynactin 1